MTTKLTDEQIAELERLERDATPGPWERWVGHGTIVAGPAKRNTRASIGGHRATVCEVEDDDGWDDEEPEANGDADADFIPAARNALPALLAEVRASRSYSGSGDRVRALEEALRVIEIEVSMFLDEDDGQVARLHTVLNVVRALSPQGDGGTER